MNLKFALTISIGLTPNSKGPLILVRSFWQYSMQLATFRGYSISALGHSFFTALNLRLV